MSRASDCSRLCRLINDSLSPYTESKLISLTKENEKHLLISLSLVSRGIQLWINELDCDSENERVDKPVGDEKCCSMPHSEERHSLTTIVADLIALLTVKSQYVQHSAGNILVVISEFLGASGSNWGIFIHFLCVSMELVIINMLSCCGLPFMTGLEELNFGPSSFDMVLKPRLKSGNLTTVAGTIRVLRNILKYLKQEYDDQLVEVYLESISSSLSNIPWHLFDEIFGQNVDAMKSSWVDALDLGNISAQEPRIVFLGNFVQLLCSLVDQSSLLEASDGSPTKHPILLKIINLIPRLLCWCLGKQGHSADGGISQYFRHKLLVLMIRLSFQADLECSVLVTWLQLLHIYFQELLLQPINQLEPSQDDCLDGSPFLLSISDGKFCGTHSRHIQRLAVFLFLRCSFSLISLRGDSDKQCVCATQNSCLAFDSISSVDNCCRNEGLLDLYEWIEGHLRSDMFVDHKMYIDKCISFALSFLQLYMHEDDLLFKMLLQLLNVPFSAEQQFLKEKWTFQDAKQDNLFHVSNIFNPIHLFHIFLSELHYDHQVLLDYLISKDTGISCAEYLLRCLRTVCNSWHLFVEFSLEVKVIDESSFKKRKVLLEGSNFLAELSSSDPVSKIPLSQEKECIEKEYDCKHYGAQGQPFFEARNCLLFLKKSVENLHRKNLFPYNPEVLLKRYVSSLPSSFN